MHAVNVQPTGKIRLRSNWRGKLILQLEESGRTESPYDLSLSPHWYRWRDATVNDLPFRTGDGRQLAITGRV